MEMIMPDSGSDLASASFDMQMFWGRGQRKEL